MLKIVAVTLIAVALCAPVQALQSSNFPSRHTLGSNLTTVVPASRWLAQSNAQKRRTQSPAQPRMIQQRLSQQPAQQRVIQQRLPQQPAQQRVIQHRLPQQPPQQRVIQHRLPQQPPQQRVIQQRLPQQPAQPGVIHVRPPQQPAQPGVIHVRPPQQPAQPGVIHVRPLQQPAQSGVIHVRPSQPTAQQDAAHQKALQQQMIQQGVSRARLSNGPGRAIVGSPSVAHLHLVRLGNNQISPIYRHQRHYWRRGAWRTFIPLSALGVALIGGTYLYADGYIPVGRQYCEGITLDGCHLNWRLVEFVDGGEDWQCVQYCPRPGVLPPPRTVTLVAPPPPPEGKCELSIYSEPNFGSVPVTTSQDQAQLSEFWLARSDRLNSSAGGHLGNLHRRAIRRRKHAA